MGNCCCKSGAAGAVAATQSDRGEGGNPLSGIGKGTGRSTLNGGSGVGKQGASVTTANQNNTCCFVANLDVLSLSKACHRLVVLVDLARPTQTTVQWKAHRPSKSPWL